MSARLLTIAASGWLLVALLAVTIRLPYRWRRHERRPAGLRLHYWLGYAIAALALAHGIASMTRGVAGRAHAAGLRLASLALVATLAEVAIGLRLRQRLPWRRAAVRRIHFWVMAALVALVAVHVALDSWLLGTSRAPLIAPPPSSAPAVGNGA